MQIRNWHKRNRNAATAMDATAAVNGSSYGHGRDSAPYIQIRFRVEGKGILSVTMTPEECETLVTQLSRAIECSGCKS